VVIKRAGSQVIDGVVQGIGEAARRGTTPEQEDVLDRMRAAALADSHAT
jgi:hypothetical protein